MNMVEETVDRGAEGVEQPVGTSTASNGRVRIAGLRQRLGRAKRPDVNPYVVVGAAFVAGVVLAKLLDRRGRGGSS
jgi:hypothetical protein